MNPKPYTLHLQLITEQGRGQILDTVAELQERHEAVRELERKLLELYQIFLAGGGAV